MVSKRMKKTLVTIETRDQLEFAMAQISTCMSGRDGLVAKLENEITDARARYEPQITSYGETINENFEACQRWAEANPSAFATKKSLDLMHGTLGFRTSTPRLKLLSGWNWNRVLEMLAVNKLTDYIRQKQEPDKERLLADRETLTDATLKRVGVTVAQDETFYIDPKREDAGSTVGKVAGLLVLLALPFLGGCYTPSEEERESFWTKRIAIQEQRQADALERIAATLEQKGASDAR